jgi:diaminohydroxyphosphoribosylaminopyrimidine deaminase/5-amino-6-(5-phosphoribosylamino)uracil reductase
LPVVSASDRDVTAMRRAVVLSALGLGRTSPNPPVGCVIVGPDGDVVGEGFHERKGGPHAERNALDAAVDRAAGATAYVTLEPCCHHGRTPPCHQALVDAGVVRVVIAVLDPTSRGVGGAALLREAGAKVDVGVLGEEALVVLGTWLDGLERGRPRVIWAYRQDADGGGALPADLLARLRSTFDVVVGDGFVATEAVAGAHGGFTVPPLRAEDGPAAALRALYDGGARSVLLAGGRPLGEAFVTAGLVNEVRVWVTAPASGTAAKAEVAVVPVGFRVQAVQPVAGGVLVEAVRSG